MTIVISVPTPPQKILIKITIYINIYIYIYSEIFHTFFFQPPCSKYDTVICHICHLFPPSLPAVFAQMICSVK